MMRDWQTDEERAEDEANDWKLHLEAWLIGAATLLAIVGAAGWLV
ncbi:hypothetical protein [Porphyrobacter sp. GA68]|nr:hypothetical protein [Porphyrobacter sp. GA68]